MKASTDEPAAAATTGTLLWHSSSAHIQGQDWNLTFLGAFLSFLARAFLGLPSLLSLAGFSLAAALGALAFLGAGLASDHAGRFFGFGTASCSGSGLNFQGPKLSYAQKVAAAQ